MAEELNGFPGFDDRGQTSLFVKARLRPGVTLPQADTAVGAVAAQLTRDRMESWDPARRFVLLPLTDVLLFPPMDGFIRAAAWLLTVVVGLVLLLACTNLASFLLARALDRRKEVAVRLALGASRGSLVRRLLTETTLLSLLAGGAGVGLASVASPSLTGFPTILWIRAIFRGSQSRNVLILKDRSVAELNVVP